MNNLLVTTTYTTHYTTVNSVHKSSEIQKRREGIIITVETYLHLFFLLHAISWKAQKLNLCSLHGFIIGCTEAQCYKLLNTKLLYSYTLKEVNFAGVTDWMQKSWQISHTIAKFIDILPPKFFIIIRHRNMYN